MSTAFSVALRTIGTKIVIFVSRHEGSGAANGYGRLIGTVWREYLYRILFSNQGDLERKLESDKAYHNQYCCRTGLGRGHVR